MRIKTFGKSHWPVLSLVLLELLLFLTNYKAGTYLVGWDNIMPEFNLGLNFNRALFSIWQEYRGLGLLDGMSHAANLFHTIYIWILSLFLPQNMLRYVFLHLTHLAGGIGFFYLMHALTKKKTPSFIGALFYMFNIGVVQMYFGPLEVFATHFAALPIVTLLTINALHHPTKRQLLYLFIGALLLSPQGFVPTVFIAYGILVFFMLLIHTINTRHVKSALLAGTILFCANAFWLLPYAYSALHTAPIIKNSRINQASSEEIYYRNKANGDLHSVLMLKGFMLETIELNPDTKRSEYFMDYWRNHYNGIPYQLLFISVIGMMLGGITYSIKTKQTIYVPFLLTFLTAGFFLANNTPLLATANDIFRDVFPLLGEAFRFPFTKFITLFAFCFAIFVTLGLAWISHVTRYSRVILIGSLLVLSYLSYPAFLGYFTSPFLRLPIPREYLQLFETFTTMDPNSRVAMFPVNTFWNWQYRSWGHRGSGFLWYGIPQPTIERAFDPWSGYNEQFYNEISHAVRLQDITLLENVLRKYDVRYLILDKYLQNTLSPQPLNYDSLQKFLAQSSLLHLRQDFGGILLYEADLPQGWIYTMPTTKTIRVYPGYSYERIDMATPNTSNYIVSKEQPDIINLFPSLYTEKLQDDIEFNATYDQDAIRFSPKQAIGAHVTNGTLRVPSLFETEFLIPVRIEQTSTTLRLQPIYPTITVNGEDFTVTDEPITLTPKLVRNPKTITFVDSNHTILMDSDQRAGYLLNPYKNAIKLSDGTNEEILVVDTEQIARNSFAFPLTAAQLDSVQVSVPTIDSPFVVDNILETDNYEVRDYEGNTNQFTRPFVISTTTKSANGLTFTVRNTSRELTFYRDNLFHQGSYIIFARAHYGQGLPMRFYTDNTLEKRPEVEMIFSKTNPDTIIVVPQTDAYFKGYGFHFITKSIGKETAQTTLESISLAPFPGQFLKNLRIMHTTIEAEPNYAEKHALSFTKPNIATYIVQQTNSTDYLVLSQSYDTSWKAYSINDANSKLQTLFPFVFGNELKDHVLVNNWANGWTSNNNNEHVVLIYLPQYLQYSGQAITLISLLGLLIAFLRPRK